MMQSKIVNLDHLIMSGSLNPDIKTGQYLENLKKSKFASKLIFSHHFPDGVMYFYEDEFFTLTLLFDNENKLFEVKLGLEESNLKFLIDGISTVNISFDMMIKILDQFKLDWQFDSKRTYSQIATIILGNNLRMVFSFNENEINECNKNLIYLVELDLSNELNKL